MRPNHYAVFTPNAKQTRRTQLGEFHCPQMAKIFFSSMLTGFPNLSIHVTQRKFTSIGVFAKKDVLAGSNTVKTLQNILNMHLMVNAFDNPAVMVPNRLSLSQKS